MYNTTYLIELITGACIVLTLKYTIIYPRYISSKSQNVYMCRVVFDPPKFVYKVSVAYHCGFNRGLNATEAFNWVNTNFLNVGILESSVWSGRRLLHSVHLTWKVISLEDIYCIVNK